MPEFLELLPPGQALDLWLQTLPAGEPNGELIPLETALNRVLVRPVIASESLPPFQRSTVDGYAVRASDTYGSSDTLPGYLRLIGEVPMGAAPAFDVQAGSAAVIHTGGMLPVGSDAVVMLENVQSTGGVEIEVLRAVAVGENVLQAGEDVRPGQVILEKGVRLRPPEIGGLAALGILQVVVAKAPRIAVLSSGDEVVPPAQIPGPGQVRDVNSYSLSALIEQAGGIAVRYGILPDNANAFETALRRAMDECDAIVITAGSSASTRDLTAQMVDQLGRPGVLVHGVNVRPGKPTILAVCNGKPVIGLPGNPVSALVIAGLFVKPVIHQLLGQPKQRLPMASARLAINLPSQAGREDWVPARLTRSAAGEWSAEPIFFKSNLIFTLAQADGLIFIPADANGVAAGDWVQVAWL